MVRLSHIITAFGAAFALGAPSLHAQTDTVASMGPLQDVVPTSGSDGTWSASVEDGAFVLTNEIDPGAIQYFYADYSSDDAGSRTIKLDVKATGGTGSAGIFYGFDPETRYYFLLVMNGSDLEFHRRDANGVNLMMATSFDDVSEDDFNTIAITENGSEISLSLNGVTTGSIENSSTGKGPAGIAAMGTGTFAFKDFSITN